MNSLQLVLGAYSDKFHLQWNVDDGYDAENAARRLSASTDTWTDGCTVKGDVSLVCVAGAGMFSKHSSDVWSHGSCGHLLGQCWYP